MTLTALNAAKQYQSLRPATTPQPGGEGAVQTAVNAAKDFAETLAMSETESVRAMSGDGDPHKLVHALAQTELAVETAVAVRDKVVEAYQEILRMPV
ncbi:flagellar hook-basal body complex protein FliE [Poseidonocella sedimentorum]|uniref:Flagellar hook-basal body complex protein FliE n=1 Tax=Poseidonocella sedimentorum TaxID=871652 RepID=A0A1I6D5C8_9RHOB|nr:flagellar hook-basal body complex protein FliE [Poseidonocella sedimentorum]SFR00658.1 flagellar hook-basal body complex protein FliE [Poseidonocella sedimentorum]